MGLFRQQRLKDDVRQARERDYSAKLIEGLTRHDVPDTLKECRSEGAATLGHNGRGDRLQNILTCLCSIVWSNAPDCQSGNRRFKSGQGRMDKWKYSAEYKARSGASAFIVSSVRAKSFDEAYKQVRDQLKHQSLELVGLELRKD